MDRICNITHTRDIYTHGESYAPERQSSSFGPFPDKIQKSRLDRSAVQLQVLECP